MAKIVVERAPPTALPRLFLMTTPAWGVVAGLLLIFDGGAALQTRWAPMTLALVHVFTLGVLGNAMLGSLLQFLPAAAGGRVGGGIRTGRLLHVLLNAGAASLVTGMRATQPALLAGGGQLLASAFVLFAGMVLPGLLRRPAGEGASANTMATALRPTRVGIAFSVVALLVTASLGLGLLSAWTGHGGLPPLPWTDVHATWGLLGWGLGLVASVGAVVLPMFQGTRTVPAHFHYAYLASIASVLVAGTLGVLRAGDTDPLRWGAAACLGAIALTGLWLQWRARHTRNTWLVRAWRAGLAALGMAAAVLAAGDWPLLAGALLLGIGFPWLVAGMQLEIVAFLGWIELHRRCGRGVRLPAVHVLMTEREKAGVFVAFAVAALALLLATLWPVGARLAGTAMVLGHALLWYRLLGVGRRVRGFIASTQDNTDAKEAMRAP